MGNKRQITSKAYQLTEPYQFKEVMLTHVLNDGDVVVQPH